MTIAEFIQEYMESLLEEWEEYASTQLPAAQGMDTETLRNFAEGMLSAIVKDMQTSQTRGEQHDKSRGDHAGSGQQLSDAGRRHAADRFVDTFTQSQLVAELRALRARVVRRWQDQLTSIGAAELDEVSRFNEAVDQLVIESLAHYDRQLGQAKEELSETRLRERQLQNLNREKDHFLSMFAHELRNPLAPILNAAELLEMKKNDLEPPMDRAATVILRQTQHLAHLVDDLLDTARINSGRIQLRREICDLVELAREAAENFRPGLTAAGHEFLVSLPDEALPVDADRHRIVQVLDNLLDNAAKFTAPAGGTISLKLERAEDEAVLRVVDTGRGIYPADLPRLFDLFEQRGMKLDRSTGGMGLGLFLVKQLIELHGGTVAARSEGEGCGSEFIVRLPLAAQHPSREADEDAAPRGPTRRVLVIEDNADAAESMELLLTELGHEVRTAGDGPGGLAAAEAFQPDVALVDIGLPGIDGFEVARRLRRRFGAGVHLIALTGYSEPVYRQTAAHAGFNAHLVKPSTVDDIKRVFSEHRHDDQAG